MGFQRIWKKPVYYALLALGRALPDTVWADAFYLKLLYRHRMKKALDLKNPKNYNEKLQWLKLYDRNVRMTLAAW